MCDWLNYALIWPNSGKMTQNGELNNKFCEKLKNFDHKILNQHMSLIQTT
jgi:hypothetical protein